MGDWKACKERKLTTKSADDLCPVGNCWVLAHTIVYNPLEIPVGVSLLAIAVYQCHLHWLTRRYREQAHSYRKADLYFG
ncbi:hypothetical protein RS1P1_00070 [Pseudomonas moraviensis]|nr:hypothetical protein RS1P1_00070 [Pseudomonas moraviensis]